MSHEPKVVGAVHIKHVLDPWNLQLIVKRGEEAIKEIIDPVHPFDAIAFRGMSGAIPAPALALACGKSLILVRKGEDCHSCEMVEGDYAAKRYLIVDDFMSSGKTVVMILREIKKYLPEAECVGMLKTLCLDDEEEKDWREQYFFDDLGYQKRRAFETDCFIDP